MLLLARLNRRRLRLFGIDTILLDCLLYHLTLDFAIITQGLERGDHDIIAINFKEGAQVVTGITTTETIGTQADET
jgi:hypothetical protein